MSVTTMTFSTTTDWTCTENAARARLGRFWPDGEPLMGPFWLHPREVREIKLRGSVHPNSGSTEQKASWRRATRLSGRTGRCWNYVPSTKTRVGRPSTRERPDRTRREAGPDKEGSAASEGSFDFASSVLLTGRGVQSTNRFGLE